MVQLAHLPEPPSLVELEEQEELVWELLDELRPILDVLDDQDASDPSPPSSRSHLTRLEEMLHLFGKGVESARHGEPTTLPALSEPRGHAALSDEEKGLMGILADALERAPASLDVEPEEVPSSEEQLRVRDAVDRYRRADLLEHVAHAVSLLRDEVAFVRRHIAPRNEARRLTATFGVPARG